MRRASTPPPDGVPSDSDARTAPRRGTALAWYRHYPGDHLRITRGWPPLARLAYRELLDAQWDVTTLPAEPDRLRTLVPGLTPAAWRGVWALIRAQFPRAQQGRQNPELEALRQVQVTLVEQCRRSGIAGNAKRWGSRAQVTPLRPQGPDAA